MVGLNKSLNYIYVKTPIFQYKYRSIRMPDMRIYVYMYILICVYQAISIYTLIYITPAYLSFPFPLSTSLCIPW